MAKQVDKSVPTNPIPTDPGATAPVRPSGASGRDLTPDGGTLESGLVSGEDVAASSLTRGTSRDISMDKSAGGGGLNLPQVNVAAETANAARPVITFRHVTKTYAAQPTNPALKDIDLQIFAGEFVFLVGHSGSGKSTFIRLITRELKPTHGQLLIADEDLGTMKNWRVPYLRRNIGCVFQDFKLLPNKTVFENVAFALEVIGKSRHVVKTQVPEVLRLVGLGEKLQKYPDQLSGGEQQRVSIARAIVNRPPMLICDEPTGNLDPQTSRGIMDLLERINKTGTTVLVATHDREMVNSMRRRVVALDHGVLTRDQDRGVYGSNV
ncbi:MAG: cell division ATP-binding protein FtsE [Coriobacteriia bacterium]|nr:cell division ATP-binding protein FtsE [Coriobacteriia bacterium]